MSETEKQLKELNDKYQKLLEEHENLKASKSRSRHSSTERQSEFDSTDTESERRKKSLKKKKAIDQEKSLARVLDSHQRILKRLGKNTPSTSTEDAELKSLINSLSRTTLQYAVKMENSHQLTVNNQSLPTAPDLSMNKDVSVTVIKECIQSLKDAFRNLFTGREDITPFLCFLNQLAVSNKVSEKQYLLLLKSRIQIGTPLYTEVAYHEENESSLKTLFKEAIPIYCLQPNYLLTLNKLNNYKPAPNTPPAQVLAQLKQIVIELANSTDIEIKPDYIYTTIKNKIFSLYPELAPSLMEEEAHTKTRNIGDFSRLFITLASTEIKKPASPTMTFW